MKTKTEVKILRIMYVIIFFAGFLLYFHYTNNSEVNIEEKEFSYEITEIIEGPVSITYKLDITEKYSDDILAKICEEIKQDYNHLYKLEDVNDKVDKFEIIFYLDGKVYQTMTNNKENIEK